MTQVYGYNIISDQDSDILNQGSIQHIKKELEKNDQDNYQDENISVNKNGRYSINSVGFVIKFLIFLFFICALCDFIG
jgi:hypothetical protein